MKHNKILLFLKNIYKSPFIPVSVVLILIKLFLVSDQPLFAFSIAVHDDLLFITHAESILKGQWLGDYNNLTLAKGVFYPIWIVITFLLGIPLLFSQHLLYILACLLFIKAIKPLVSSQWFLLLAFAFLLFNPITYSYDPFTRVIREGLYVPLTLLVISSTLGLFIRRHSKEKPLLWIVMTGISLSTFWLTREEGVWILPLFVLLYGYYIWELLLEKKNSNKEIFRKLSIQITPFIFLGISILFLSAINYFHYGIFTTVETNSKGFKSAYGALTRVEHKTWRADVPVPKSTREEIYKVSPTFQKLEPYLEGNIGIAWRNNSNSDEIRGGWFMWALRDAVAEAGYYKSAKETEDFYMRLANEINSLCEQELLKCPVRKRTTMQPPWDNRYLEPLIKTMGRATIFITQFKGFTPYPLQSIGNSETIVIFRDFTRENVNPIPGEQILPKQTILNSYKMNILEYIGKIYIILNPLLFIVAVFLTLTFLITDLVTKKIKPETIFMSSLLVMLIARIALISFIHVSSFESIIVLYLSPAYVVMSAFIIMCMIKVTNLKTLRLPDVV